MYDKIVDLHVGISYYCNLHCEHCYVPAQLRDGYRKDLEPDQLTPAEINAFMDLLRDEFALQKVAVTGGEALLSVVWPRTCEVMTHALESGLEVRLMTSGSGQVGLAQVLETARPAPGQLYLQISLDGTSEGYVNQLRRHRFAYKWALRAIEDCVRAGVRVRVRFTAMDGNIGDAISTYDLVRDIGAWSFMVKPAFAEGEARNADEMLLTADAYRDLQLELVDRSIGNPTLLELPQPVYIQPSDVPPSANAKLWDRCSCGVDSLYLSPVGDLWPCNFSAGDPMSQEYVLGNLRDTDFDFAGRWRDPAAWSEYRNPADGVCCTSQSRGAASLDRTDTDDLVSLSASKVYPCV
jgi:MoaA/NifB/PqqE/SkfB family radical SAM enzyme